ncbi:MAG: hypothetical protein WBE18_07045 [Gammaproteobacteria bacterium]
MFKSFYYFYKTLGILALSLLWIGQAGAQTKLAPFVGGVNSGAVWTDADFFTMVGQCHKDHPCTETSTAQNDPCLVATNQCIANKMRAKGANAQAIAFAQYAPVPSAINKFKNYGKVAVVHARMQWADAADGFFLINKQGMVIPVANPKVIKDPYYQTFLKQFPKAFIVGGPGRLDWPKVSSDANNNQGFIFSFPMVDGCMACAKVGTAEVAYLFGQTGNFLGTRILKITATTTTPQGNKQ